MSNVTYQEDKWADCQDEVGALWDAHAKETGLQINPDNGLYVTIERQGLLLFATMRADGQLVGVYRCVLGLDLHNKRKIYGCGDGWFILPRWRLGMAAIRLLWCAEEIARKRGIDYLYQVSPVWRDIGPILKRDKWTMTGVLYQKEL